MSAAARTLVVLNGSPVRGSNIDLLLGAMIAGAEGAGGRAIHYRCHELAVRPCEACGPDATSGYCIFHDAMDEVYAALESAHAIAVASPVYFDTVSAQLKLVIDRCNCVTPLVRLPGGGEDMVPKWGRTRRGVFVTARGERFTHELAERTVRGFLKWVGARWEETLAYPHADNDAGSVTRHPELVERARVIGRRLIESAPLEPA
jgi:NAD(P)H-dependent FMN reductase